MKVVCFKVGPDIWLIFHEKYKRRTGEKLREFIINDLGYNQEWGKTRRVRNLMERS